MAKTPIKLGRLSRMAIKANRGKTEFRFRFSFVGLRQSIEFQTSGRGAMLVMGGLRQLQARYKIPIPPEARASGRPTLHAVKLDD